MHFKIKTISGNKYLYLIQNAWIDGKVKQVQQICVGSPDKIYQMMIGTQPISIKSFSFGKGAALKHAAERLGLIKAIDDQIEKKNISGLTVGEYMLLLIMGRSEGIKSRKGIEEWFRKSVLYFILNPEYQLSCQNFLNQMKSFDNQIIESIEDSLTRNLIELGISPTSLIFDTTNRFSYIENGEELFKRGNCKYKRFDKNIVGLALAINNDNLPFLSEVYSGNEHDSKVFQRVFEKICKRIEIIGIEDIELAIIFDKGNNSKDNIEKVLEKMHVIGSLPRSEAGNLFQISLEQYKYIYTNNKGHEIKAWRTREVRYGLEFELIIQYNPATMKRQKETYETRKAKIQSSIEDLYKSCFRKGKGRKPTEKGIINSLGDIIPKDLRGVFDYKVKHTEDGKPYPYFEIDPNKKEQLYQSFGKTLIFTDNKQYSTKEIVQAYNSKYLIEENFKWLNDKIIIPIWPFFVRKDLTVRAHVFLCLLGLMLYRFLLWELNMEGLTIPKLASLLERIRLSILLEGQRKAKFVIEEMDKDQIKIFSKLDLGRYIP